MNLTNFGMWVMVRGRARLTWEREQNLGQFTGVAIWILTQSSPNCISVRILEFDHSD